MVFVDRKKSSRVRDKYDGPHPMTGYQKPENQNQN
jgi:hypothetical protein